MSAGATTRIVIVGGGIAGLAASVRLVQAGMPVTLLEASELGGAASTRNQGWLHSGGVYALESAEYARMCHASLQQTLSFCPECVEPELPPMAYLFCRPESLVSKWTSAWSAAEIPYREIPIDDVCAGLPGMNRSRLQHAYQLPDRAIRTEILLEHLAATAQNSGVEIRTRTHVKALDSHDGRVCGVITSTGETIAARLVILAGGATGFDLSGEFLEKKPGGQSEVELVTLRTHLVALHQSVGRLPFCIVDADRFNHIPHPPVSVFGSEHWECVKGSNGAVEPAEIERICARIRDLFPRRAASAEETRAWSGTILQALRADQIEPGRMLWPAVIDHAQHAPRIANLVSVVPGRATLWPHLAEEARRIVLAKLDVSAAPMAHPPWLTG